MKRETRILGLDCCNPNHIVGVVTRGGSYLDGVIVFERFPVTATLAGGLTRTKYFPELRAIMTHGSKNPIDPSVIERETGLPVIAVSTDRCVDGQGYKRVSIPSQRLGVRASIHPPSLQNILSLTMIRGNLPEPVRIAHLLGKLSMPEIDHAR